MPPKTKEPIELHCQLSGKLLTTEEAIFIVLAPDGTVMFDLNKELPGKHLCLESKESVIENAVKQGVIESFYSENSKIPNNFT